MLVGILIGTAVGIVTTIGFIVFLIWLAERNDSDGKGWD